LERLASCPWIVQRPRSMRPHRVPRSAFCRRPAPAEVLPRQWPKQRAWFELCPAPTG
jgi:hypothetical protein